MSLILSRVEVEIYLASVERMKLISIAKHINDSLFFIV